MRRRTRLASAAAALAASLALPTAAGAHVTLHPGSVPAGAETELVVRVPNERDDAATTKVALQLPHGFVGAEYEQQPGWSVKVVHAHLARPIQTDDGPISDEVREIVWTADRGGGIPPGAFADFPIAVLVPDDAGTLTFKALQTYSNGEVVRWIGPPSADEPAPLVTVTAAAAGDGEASHDAASAAPVSAAGAANDDGGDGPSTGLVVVALVLGALGLIAGGLALLRGGRRGSTGAGV
jgi:uncharacterized protein YcnI